MSIILALAGKDLRLLIRDRGGLFVTFFFPLVYCIFFGVIFASRSGTASSMRIALVDEDGSAASRALVAALVEAEAFDVQQTDPGEATALVRRGKCVGYVIVPSGYGRACEQLLWGETPSLTIGVDPARRAESAMLTGLLSKYAMQHLFAMFTNVNDMRQRIDKQLIALRQRDNLSDMDRPAFERFFHELDGFLAHLEDHAPETGTRDEVSPASDGWQPLRIESVDVASSDNRPKNSYEVSFPQGIIWSILGCTAAFGISLVTERSRGTLSRLETAPIHRVHILAGKAVACMAAILVLTAGLLVIGRVAFNVQPRSVIHLALSLIAISIAFVGIMMFLSVLGRTERTVSGITWAVLMAMAMSGGGMVPLFFMPGWLQTISNVSPIKWAILAMEGAIWRGFSTTEMLLPWSILVGVGVAGFAIGARVFRWGAAESRA